jgi:predicted DNA-binding protein with PD1-like motif
VIQAFLLYKTYNVLKYSKLVVTIHKKGVDMKYQVGEVGRVVVARFEDGDEILQNLIDIVEREAIKTGILYLLGGIKDARIVVGPEEDRLPPVPVWRELRESYETFGIGTIFWRGDEPKIHFHGTYGKWDNVKTGCLRESANTFIVMEAIIVEIRGVKAIRDLDPASNMVLLKLLDSSNS